MKDFIMLLPSTKDNAEVYIVNMEDIKNLDIAYLLGYRRAVNANSQICKYLNADKCIVTFFDNVIARDGVTLKKGAPIKRIKLAEVQQYLDVMLNEILIEDDKVKCVYRVDVKEEEYCISEKVEVKNYEKKLSHIDICREDSKNHVTVEFHPVYEVIIDGETYTVKPYIKPHRINLNIPFYTEKDYETFYIDNGKSAITVYADGKITRKERVDSIVKIKTSYGYFEETSSDGYITNSYSGPKEDKYKEDIYGEETRISINEVPSSIQEDFDFKSIMKVAAIGGPSAREEAITAAYINELLKVESEIKRLKDAIK